MRAWSDDQVHSRSISGRFEGEKAGQVDFLGTMAFDCKALAVYRWWSQDSGSCAEVIGWVELTSERPRDSKKSEQVRPLPSTRHQVSPGIDLL